MGRPSQPASASHGPQTPCAADSPQSHVLTVAASYDPCGPLAHASQVIQPAHADAAAATPTDANVTGKSPAPLEDLVQSAARLQAGVSDFVSALSKFKKSDDRSDAVAPHPVGERLFAPRPVTQFPLAYPCRAGSTTPGPPSADMATCRPSPAPSERPADEAEPEASPPLSVSKLVQPEPWDALHQTLLAKALLQQQSAAAAGSSDLPEQAKSQPHGCHPEETHHEPGEPQPAEANEEPAVHHSGKPHEEPAAAQQPETTRHESDAPEPANTTEEPAAHQRDEATDVPEVAADGPAKGQPAKVDEEPPEQQHAQAEKESVTRQPELATQQPDSQHLDTGVAVQYRRFPATQQPEEAMREPGSLASDGVQYRRFPATPEPDTAQKKQGPTQPEIAKAMPGLPPPGTARTDAGATPEGATKDPGAQRLLSNACAQTPCFSSPGSAVPPLQLGPPDLPQRAPPAAQVPQSHLPSGSAAATFTVVHVAGGLHYNECLTLDLEAAKAVRSSGTHL